MPKLDWVNEFDEGAKLSRQGGVGGNWGLKVFEIWVKAGGLFLFFVNKSAALH
ncbi:MAG: hypothetical protein IPM82_32255 [Saprospiraceae bacterium]|nr:hypothetical protein [Saprospiraceae bacterium]